MSKQKTSNIDSDKLIELVRARDVLYNRNRSGFSVPKIKAQAWKEIVSEIGATEAECKTRWCTLRDRFTRECRLLNTQNAPNHKREPWYLFGTMSFMMKHLKHKRSHISTVLMDDSAVEYDDFDNTDSCPKVDGSFICYVTQTNNSDDYADDDNEDSEPANKQIKFENNEKDVFATTTPPTDEYSKSPARRRVPNDQVQGISQIVRHKLSGLGIRLQNEAIDDILIYLSAMEKHQAGVLKTKPTIEINTPE